MTTDYRTPQGSIRRPAPIDVAAPAQARAFPSTVLARWVRVLLWLAVAAAVVAGAVFRAWYLTHEPIDADEALIGLLARHLAEGHANAFLLGQPFGGVEPYLVAGLFALVGPSSVALRLPVIVLDAVACLLLWRVALRLVARQEIAAVAAALMWVSPQVAVWNSTMEYGFRGVTMVCGLALLLFARRAVEGRSAIWNLGGAGLAAGVGWWSSPEIAYFALPAALWLLQTAARRADTGSGRPLRLAPLAAGTAAFAVGALPWLWANAASGLASVRLSNYPVPALPNSYGLRIVDFVRYSVPMLVDLRVPNTGAWVVPRPLGVGLAALACAAVVVSAGWCLLRGGAGAALAVAVLAFPFVMAVARASVWWESGIYVGFAVPLALLLVATAGADLLPLGVRRQRRERVAPGPLREPTRASSRAAIASNLVLSSVLLLILALSSMSLVRLAPLLDPPAAQLGAVSPDRPAERLVAALEHAGATSGFADYWVAYKLDFLSGGRLSFGDTPPSPDRLPSMESDVAKRPADRQAWLFVTPTPRALAEYVDSPVIQGPSGISEGAFVADLAKAGIAARVEHVGPATVVYASRPVTFADLGLPRFRPSS